MDRTVYRAVSAYPTFVDKYGEGDALFELKYKFHLTNEELVYAMNRLIKKGLMDNYSRDHNIEYLQLNDYADQIVTPSSNEDIDEDLREDVDIINKVEERFGTSDYPPEGKTFIMPDGKFLNMSKIDAHYQVEQWLIDNGLSDVKLAYMINGSPTLSRLGCFRCNANGSYCILPEVDYPTDEALNSLLLWLDKQSNNRDSVTIVSPTSRPIKYDFADYITDDILGRVERYYTSGTLYEHQEGVIRACGAKYKRGKVGEKLTLEPADKKVRQQKEKEFLEACRKMDESIEPNKRIPMRKQGERYRRGRVGEKLTIERVCESKEDNNMKIVEKFDTTKYFPSYSISLKDEDDMGFHEFASALRENVEEAFYDFDYIRFDLQSDKNDRVYLVPVFDAVANIGGEEYSVEEILSPSFFQDIDDGSDIVKEDFDKAYQAIQDEIKRARPILKDLASSWGFRKDRNSKMVESAASQKEKEHLQYSNLEIEFDYGKIGYWDGSPEHTYHDFVDYELEVDKDDIIDWLVDFAGDDGYAEGKSDEEFVQWVKANYDTLFERYYEKLKDIYKDRAIEKAIENTDPEPEPDYDYYDDEF